MNTNLLKCLTVAISTCWLVAFSGLPVADAESELGTETRFRFRGGAQVVLHTPDNFQQPAVEFVRSLEGAHASLESMLGELPPFSTVLRVMDEEAFYSATGAPRWTNALYYRQQIIIPMTAANLQDRDGMARSIRHEYAHAAIHALSAGKCPGWLDEGLAQWWEGQENPALRPALARWMQSNEVVPFSLLQGGFTRLEENMVAAAYGQSLIASTSLVRTYGFRSLRKYFDALRRGEDKATAFSRSFGIREETFEARIGHSLRRWSDSLARSERDARAHRSPPNFTPKGDPFDPARAAHSH